MCAETHRAERQLGFTLIELLVVVAVILIVAAIAIPNLVRSRMAANQASAATAVRTVATAEIQYQSNYPQVGYSNSILQLGTGAATNPPTQCPGVATSTAACLVDGVVTAAGIVPKSGYLLSETGFANGGLNTTYVAEAGPVTYDRTGNFSYCIVPDNIVRVNLTNNASGLPGVNAVTCLQAPFSPQQ
jgi:type IV pilus assembly protein PilA